MDVEGRTDERPNGKFDSCIAYAKTGEAVNAFMTIVKLIQ